MAKVNHNDLLNRLRICPVVNSKETLCSDCKYAEYSNCTSHLIQEAADTLETLQNTVNEYSTYDTFLYAHGFFHTNPEDSLRAES